jgi:hypothetical protein
MLPLRHPRIWLVLGWIFVALAWVVSLVPPNIDTGLGMVNDKVKHGVGYAALMIWFAGLYPKSRYLWIALALLVMGIGVEFAQGAMHLGRDRDPADIAANATGIAIAWLLAHIVLGQWLVRLEEFFARRGRR